MNVHKEGYRWAEVGAVSSATCKICGAECEIHRGVVGPTNFASAIGGLKREHDHIRCPNGGARWHNQAVDLLTEIAGTRSPTIAATLRSDLQALVKRQMAP